MAPKPRTASRKTPSSKAATAPAASPSKWIRIDRSFPLPDEVKAVLSRLHDEGFVAYLVGGGVRDWLLQKSCKDYDIATSATPDEVIDLFPGAITVGKAFGVIKVPMMNGSLLEVATFRRDLEYKDHRHPEGVEFAEPDEDAKRRDFTINALFYDPKTQRVLDSVHGIEDLRAGIIRTVGNPNDRFREDALRLLRAIRFSAQLGFRIEEATESAIQARAKLVGKVSSERVREELDRMLLGLDPGGSMRRLFETGLLELILPEVSTLAQVGQPSVLSPEEIEPNVFLQTIKILNLLVDGRRKVSLSLAWAALLSGSGKAAASRRNSGKNFNGFERDSIEVAESVCRRLKRSKRETEAIVAIIDSQLKFRDVFQMREATLVRFFEHECFSEMLALHRAVALATDGNLAYFEFCQSRYREWVARASTEGDTKLLTGEDLIQLGLTPGPSFTRILRSVEDEVIEKRVLTKEQALEFVLKNFVR